jgi:phage portal protein BeeE
VRCGKGKQMSKRRTKSTSGSRATIPVEDLPFSDQMIMTERGFEKAGTGSLLAPGQSDGLVHMPQFMNLSGQTLAPKRGTRELQITYSESPWLRAIVSKIARAVAGTDWVLYAKKNAAGRYVDHGDLVSKANGKLRETKLKTYIDTNQVEVIEDHPMLTFLETGSGNPRLNGFSAMEVTQKHLDLVGEAFWLLELDDFGIPMAYWPLPPAWIGDFPTNSNPNYLVNVPRGMTVSIPATLIVPFIDPDPNDPYGRGSGIAKSLDDEIQIDEYAAKHSRSFFLNRARPDIIISGQFVNANDAARLEKQWMGDHQGFWKSFKPLFFSQKIDVKELSQTFESMQMVQLRKYERDTFVNVFGIPPEKIGLIGESKRSTIQAADMFWNKDVIKPRVEMIRRVLQQVITPRFDDRLILYYETPVIQEDEFKLAAMKIAPHASTINEWRAVQGQKSIGPAGDCFVIPLNSQVVGYKDGKLYTVIGGKDTTSSSSADSSKTDNSNSNDTTDNEDDQPTDDEASFDRDEVSTRSAFDREDTKAEDIYPMYEDAPRKEKAFVDGLVDEIMQSARAVIERMIPQSDD